MDEVISARSVLFNYLNSAQCTFRFSVLCQAADSLMSVNNYGFVLCVSSIFFLDFLYLLYCLYFRQFRADITGVVYNRCYS